MGNLGMKSYDAAKLLINFGPYIISGFGDGDFCEIDQASDAWEDEVGADSEVVRSKSNDLRVYVDITVFAASPVNGQLNTLAELDRISGLGVQPISIRDQNANGISLVAGESAWIKKKPKRGFGKKAGTLQWRIVIAQALNLIQGY